MSTSEADYVLYHFDYSICAIMVRYVFACRGEPRDAHSAMRLKEIPVDLIAGEQLTEHFLCDVNANGEVPVLVPSDTGKPMPESVDITYYMAERYPALLPTDHEQDIKKFISKLHEINFFSLTFTGQPKVPQSWKKILQDELDSSPSERYRKSINHKMGRLDEQKLTGLAEKTVSDNIKRAKALTQDLEKVVKDSPTDWCFGLDQPSALDAHLVVFIARMQDVDRADLIPETLRQYAAKAMKTDEWQSVMQGRSTRPPGAR